MNWFKTDELQYCKEKGESEYEYAEITEIVKGKYLVRIGTLNWEDYSKEDKFDAMKTYGYDTYESMKKEYGDSWQQIILECIFELNSDFDVEAFENFSEALKFLKERCGIN